MNRKNTMFLFLFISAGMSIAGAIIEGDILKTASLIERIGNAMLVMGMFCVGVFYGWLIRGEIVKREKEVSKCIDIDTS